MVRRSLLIVSLMVVSATLLPVPVAAGGGCYAPSEIKLSTSTESTALIEDCAFQPTVTYIEPGDKVTWRNNDIFGHTVSGANGSWGNDTNLAKGDTVSFTFEDEGVFPYYCAFHPSMVGAVVVGDGMGEGSGDAASAIAPADDPPPTARESAGAEEGSSQAMAITLGLGALGVVVALMTWRTRRLRRTHAAATTSL